MARILFIDDVIGDFGDAIAEIFPEHDFTFYSQFNDLEKFLESPPPVAYDLVILDNTYDSNQADGVTTSLFKGLDNKQLSKLSVYNWVLHTFESHVSLKENTYKYGGAFYLKKFGLESLHCIFAEMLTTKTVQQLSINGAAGTIRFRQNVSPTITGLPFRLVAAIKQIGSDRFTADDIAKAMHQQVVPMSKIVSRSRSIYLEIGFDIQYNQESGSWYLIDLEVA